MHWEEKIDRLKKEFDPTDFKIPFTDGSIILKKIEDKFVVKENSNYRFSNWHDRVKDKRKVKELLTANLDTELDKLDLQQNYWIVVAGNKDLVYDCKPTVIKEFWRLWAGDFYIVEKKYNWLTYFKVDKGDTEVFKSGDFATPFDKK